MDSVITKFHDTLLYGTGLTLPINVKLLDEVVKTKKLTFQFRGTLKKQQIKRRLPFEDNPLREILWNDSGKDLTLVIENKEIKVHKFLMAARSSYFQAMLNSPWIENVENQTIVQEFSFEVTEKAVKFIYDFPLVFSSMEDALGLLDFGEYYNVADLKTEAEKYLIAQINANTVCALANASMKCNSQNLRLLCLNYLLKCQKTSFPIFGLETLDPEFNNELTKRIFCVIQSS
uniref:BTB domain-containing protein n=1 Tax=Panagrolaimus sp. ES5 TaxID=591445 RepID=A0AC34G7Y3_9BILA